MFIFTYTIYLRSGIDVPNILLVQISCFVSVNLIDYLIAGDHAIDWKPIQIFIVQLFTVVLYVQEMYKNVENYANKTLQTKYHKYI